MSHTSSTSAGIPALVTKTKFFTKHFRIEEEDIRYEYANQNKVEILLKCTFGHLGFCILVKFRAF